MLRKVKRIFFRTFAILLSTVVLLTLFLFFGIQTYVFQNWLGHRAGAYLSSELHSKIYIDRIELDFFSRASLKGILLLDKNKDTLFAGDVYASVKTFDYENRKLLLQTLTLRNATAKIIQYKNDTVFNYDFLARYFAGGEKDTLPGKDWDVKLGDVVLDNVTFNYRNNNHTTAVSTYINYNNILVSQTSGIVRGFKLSGDTVMATLKQFKTREQCGFVLNNLNTGVKISNVELVCDSLSLSTPASLVEGRLQFKYNTWDDYTDFVNKVNMNALLSDSTHVFSGDIACFAPELKGLDKSVWVAGSVNGSVSDLRLKNFRLAYGHSTKFNGNLSLSGLPDIGSSFLHFDAKELSTSYEDIVSIPLYPFTENKYNTLPTELKRLGKISYKGKFDGFVNDFTTYGRFATRLGKVDAKLSISIGEKAGDVRYDGKIASDNFSLGTLFGQSNLNGLALNCEIKGKGLTISDVDAILDGQVHSVEFNHYVYHNIALRGQIKDKLFNGFLQCHDPNADFVFDGTANLKPKIPEMDFISTINTLRLNQLHITNQTDSGSFSSQLLINIKGDNLDNLSGQVNFDNTIYKTKTREYKLSTLDLLLDQGGEDKKIRLNSAYLNAILRGRYKLSNLGPAFEQMLGTYFPSYFKSKPTLAGKKNNDVKKYTDEFVFKLTVKKFNVINELFLQDIMLSPGSTADGTFAAGENKFNLQFSSPKCSYNNIVADNLNLVMNENNTSLEADLSAKAMRLGDSLSLANFSAKVSSFDRNTGYTVSWDNLSQPVSRGELKGRMAFENENLRIDNEKISIVVTDSVWQMEGPSTIKIGRGGRINFSPLIVSSRQQNIQVSGALSDKTSDSLLIGTRNLLLAQFNPLLRLFKLKLNGVVNGKTTLSNAGGKFVFDGNLNLSDFNVNDNAIGELDINANYVAGDKLVKLGGYTSLGLQDEQGTKIKNMTFNGTYYLDRKEESLDLDYTASPLNLRLLNPFLEGILTINQGYVRGNGKIHGTPANLKIEGDLNMFNTEIKVDYTNVTYKLDGKIEVMPDQIRFSEVKMREKGTAAPQGTINGNVFHTNFSRIQLDYDVTYRNMLVLNTTEKENNLFYGRVYGSGNVGLWGFLNNIHMQVRDTTTRNSRFFLPLDGPAEVSEDDFVTFVKKDTVKVDEKPLTGFNLDLAVYATPNATAHILLDKQNGDALNVQGQGDIKMNINTLGKFEMFGDYLITNGDYLFTLENVINKKFEIEAGSSISWAGDPINADINIVTSYKQRASVAPLLNDTTGQYKGRFPTDCKLLIDGKLFSPRINFRIDFPTLDATAKSRIDNILSDEAELNRQVFAFLLFRTFLTPQIFNANGGGVTAGNAAASTGSELLSNRVSEFLNTYFGNLTGLRDLELGLNYRPGSQNSGDAVELALSKKVNDKISVDGNFGLNGNQTGNSNGLIGDININYKLTDDGRYKLKGFNHTNDVTQATIAGGPYTQGIGFFYREEFETFNDLFNLYLRKLKRKDDKKQAKPQT